MGALPCRQSLLQERNVLSETFGIVAFDIFGPYKGDAYVSMAFVALALFFAAWRTLYSPAGRAEDGNHGRPSNMRLILAAYMFITGVFNIILMAGLTKFGVAAAALHNLAEWGIVAYLYFNQEQALVFYKIMFMFIWFIITVVTLVIDDVKIGFAFEEVFGIWVDVLLLYRFIQKSLPPVEPDPTNTVAKRRFFKMAAIAAGLHMSNILTLALMGTGLIRVNVGQIIVVVTIVPTFFLYSEFALAWDKKVLELVPIKPDETPYVRGSPNWPNVATSFLISLAIGILIIVGPLVGLKQCDYNQPCKNNSLYGYSFLEVPNSQAATAQSLIANVATQTRAQEKGNMFWLAFSKSIPATKTTKFAVFEQYTDPTAMTSHLAEPYVSSGLVQFASKYTMSLDGPFQDINVCEPVVVTLSGPQGQGKNLCVDPASIFTITSITVKPEGQAEFANRFETLKALQPNTKSSTFYVPLQGVNLKATGQYFTGTFAIVELWEGSEAQKDQFFNDLTGAVADLVNSDEWHLYVTSFTQEKGYQMLVFC